MPRPLTDIETVAFADGVIARNLRSGALCRLNATAGMILEWIGEGRSVAEAAENLTQLYGIGMAQASADVETIVQAWREAGLLLPEESGDPPAEETQAEGAADFDASLDLWVNCGGKPVRVRCQEEELSGLLAEVLAPARVAPPAAADTDPRQHLDLQGEEGDFRCRCDGATMWRAEYRPLARRLLLQDIIGRSLPAERLSAILHASAVSIGGRAVILAGKSGSGKSTLTAGLAAGLAADPGAADARLIADDLLPLGSAADGVWPVPFAISVKEGSWPVIAPLYAEFEQLKVLTSRGMKVRYLAAAMAEAGHPVEPALVIFPTWDSRATSGTERLSAEALADGLIETGTDLTGADGTLADFAEFASTVPAYRILYNSLREGTDLVRSLLKR